MKPIETEITKISDNAAGEDRHGNRLTFRFKDCDCCYIALNYQGSFHGDGHLEITIKDEDQKPPESTTQTIFEPEIRILRDYLSAMLGDKES